MENFQAIQPSELLVPYVKQYWFLSVNNFTQGSQRSIPAGYIGLTFNRGEEIYSSMGNSPLPRSYVFGQSTKYTNTYFKTLNLIIVVFQPIGAKAFFKMPMNKLNGQTIPIDALSDPYIIELEDRLMETKENQTCVHLIEQFLLKRICHVEEYNYKRLASVVRSINYGEREISKLAQAACLSHKQFNRIFLEYTGLHPKEFLQIKRFTKAIHTLQTQPLLNLSELAYECGYYDKSHLIKEIKSYSGYTPMEFLSNCDPYSDYMSLFQSFFINTKY